MKRIALIIGMIIVLAFSMIILSACDSVDDSTKDTSDTTVNETSTEEITWNDYTYNELSFKLPSNYTESNSGSDETKIYSTNMEDDAMYLFSLANISAQGTDFVSNAAESLGEYKFELTGYEVNSKTEPKIAELNGLKTVSVDVKYSNTTTSDDAEVEYCYAQKGDTVYVICYELFTQNGKKIEDSDFDTSFNEIKNTLKFAE